MARWAALAAWLGVLLCLPAPGLQSRGLAASPAPSAGTAGTQQVAPPPPEPATPPPPPPPPAPPASTPPPPSKKNAGKSSQGGGSGVSQVSAPRLADSGACRNCCNLGSSPPPLACRPNVAARTTTSEGPQPRPAAIPALQGGSTGSPPEGPELEVAAPEPPPPRPECLTPGGLGSNVHCMGSELVARGWASESDRSGAGLTPIQQQACATQCVLLLRRSS